MGIQDANPLIADEPEHRRRETEAQVRRAHSLAERNEIKRARVAKGEEPG